MGSIKRKIERKKFLKKKKVMDKAMKNVTEKVDAMPKVCGECGDAFDKADKEMLNQWRIAVYDDGQFHLTCPKFGPTPEEIEASEKSDSKS